jgi:hypothetical protein
LPQAFENLLNRTLVRIAQRLREMPEGFFGELDEVSAQFQRSCGSAARKGSILNATKYLALLSQRERKPTPIH